MHDMPRLVSTTGNKHVVGHIVQCCNDGACKHNPGRLVNMCFSQYCLLFCVLPALQFDTETQIRYSKHDLFTMHFSKTYFWLDMHLVCV